jgi:DNA-binding transcriptional MerR regulator
VDRLSIGDFSRQSRLSQKALRLYDELGLLVPAYVDPGNGYRFYEVNQLDRARFISSLRRVEVPLAEIRVILELERVEAAARIEKFWANAEAHHHDRRTLVTLLTRQLKGETIDMYDVTTREVPERTLLCLQRHAEDEAAVWKLGKEFVGYFKERPLPVLEGRQGATFLLYHGEVNADSDGPVEMCRPIRAEEAEEIAPHYPELSLRREKAHSEAVVHIGTGETTEAQWQLASESLRTWATEQGYVGSDLGVRITYFVEPPRTEKSVPDLDFAVPVVRAY